MTADPVTLAIRRGDRPRLQQLHKALVEQERDAKMVCDAATRIAYPSAHALCATHKAIRAAKSRAARALRKK